MVKNAWFLFIAVSYSSICFAGEDNKWFIGLGVGNAAYENSVFSENDDLIFFSGGHAFNEIFSVEIGYIDLGGVKGRLLPNDVISLTQDTLSLDAKGFTVASKFSWEVALPLVLSAKVGVSVLDIDKRWSGGTLVDTSLANDTGGTETEFFLGAQLQYKISESFSVELNWDRYEVEGINVDGVYAKTNIHF
jgi:hypothetical protein